MTIVFSAVEHHCHWWLVDRASSGFLIIRHWSNSSLLAGFVPKALPPRRCGGGVVSTAAVADTGAQPASFIAVVAVAASVVAQPTDTLLLF